MRSPGAPSIQPTPFSSPRPSPLPPPLWTNPSEIDPLHSEKQKPNTPVDHADVDRPSALVRAMHGEPQDSDPASPDALPGEARVGGSEAPVAPNSARIPEGWEGRERTIGGTTVRNTRTLIAPSTKRRVREMMDLPPPVEGDQASIKAYIDAMVARDEQARRAAGGDRLAAATVERPRGVPQKIWDQSQAVSRSGLSTRDVEVFLVTGQLPDLVVEERNEHDELIGRRTVQSGQDRIAVLEARTRRRGNWKAVNTFSFLLEMRRALGAAERRALEQRLAGLPPRDLSRTGIRAAIDETRLDDQGLHTVLQTLYRDATVAREQSGQRSLQKAQRADQRAIRLEAAGDIKGARSARDRAQKYRDRAARIAYEEAEYRNRFCRFASAGSTFQLAARAQIATGQAEFARLVRENAPPPDSLASVQARGKAPHGVPSAEALLASARGSGRQGATQLALEIDRQRLSAHFERWAAERSGYFDRVDSNGKPPAARTVTGRRHNKRYLEAQAQAASLIAKRIRQYGPIETVRTNRATDVAQLRAEYAEIMGELSHVVARSLATDRQLSEARSAVQQLEPAAAHSRSVMDEAHQRLKTDRAARSQRYASTNSMLSLDDRNRRVRADADRIVEIRRTQVAITEARDAEIRADLADARNRVRILEAQAERDTEDAQSVRIALGRTGIPTSGRADAYRQSHTRADESAREASAALHRATSDCSDVSDPVHSARGSTHARLSLHWTRSTEQNLLAHGDDGREAATARLAQASAHARQALGHHQALGSRIDRQTLAHQLVLAESRLAAAQADYHPGHSRDRLRHAEAIAHSDLRTDDDTYQAARVTIAQASAEALVRRDARLLETTQAGHHDSAAGSDLLRQTRTLLEELPADDRAHPELTAVREVVAQFDQAMELAPLLFVRSVEQAQQGHELAASYVRLMAHDEGDAAANGMSVVMTLPLRPFVDIRGQTRALNDLSAQNVITNASLRLGWAQQGAEDLASAYARARAQGRGVEFLDAVRLKRQALKPSAIPSRIAAAVQERMLSFLPEDQRHGPAPWMRFGSTAWLDEGIPLAQALGEPILAYASTFKQVGDENLAVVTRDSARVMQGQADDLINTASRLGVALTLNTIGEVGLGLVTGSIGSAAALNKAGQVANSVRKAVQVAKTARATGILGRIGSGAQAFRAAHPILYTASATAGVGTSMAGTSYAARRTFGHDSAAAELAELGAVVVPIGVANRAAGLSTPARRAATVPEGHRASFRQALTARLVRDSLSLERFAAHGRFYGPATALSSLMGLGTLHGTPWAARSLGQEQSETTQMVIGVLLNAAFAAGGAAFAGRVHRTTASMRAADIARVVAAVTPSGMGPAQRTTAESAITRTIERFSRTTEGRMPTQAEAERLHTDLTRNLGQSGVLSPEVRAALDGVVETLRIEQAAALAFQGLDLGQIARDPKGPRTLLQTATHLLHDARGGKRSGEARRQTQRDVALAIRRTFSEHAADRLKRKDPEGAAAARTAHDRVRDRVSATEIAAVLSAAHPEREPVLNRRQAGSLVAFLETDLPSVRTELDMVAGSSLEDSLDPYFYALKIRLESELGLSPPTAVEVVRTVRGELFQGALRRELVARQTAAGSVALTNRDLSAAARQVAFRLGTAPSEAVAIGREAVSSRSDFEAAGLIRRRALGPADGKARRRAPTPLAGSDGPLEPPPRPAATFQRSFDEAVLGRTPPVRRGRRLEETAHPGRTRERSGA